MYSNTQYSRTNTPYSNSHDIPNSEYTKHYKRVQDLHKNANSNVSSGKADDYDVECERLTDVQARKITDPVKAYGRYLVAEEHGYYAIAKGFLKKYRFLTQTRGDKISSLLEDL